MSKACQIVLLACACALAPGCYLFHDGAARGAPEHDAGWAHPTPAHDSGWPVFEAGVAPPDAGPPLACPAARADVTCLESFLVAPGRPFTLPYTFDGCACCARSECRVSVDPASRTVALDTTLCPDPCDCDACNAPRGECAVPALDEGEWRVIANGAPAFVLPVHPDSGEVAPPPACASYAEPDTTSCGPSEPLPGRVRSGEGVCVDTTRHPNGLDAIRIHDPCWPCGDLRGPCVASLEPRFTDDLPPGGDLHIASSTYPIACDVDCPTCTALDRECIVPPLRDGDTYRVLVGDRVVATFVAGGPETFCAIPL